MHSPLHSDGHGTQLAALRHDDVEEAAPQAGDRFRGLVQAAAVNHQWATEQLAGPGQVVSVAANLYLEQRDPPQSHLGARVGGRGEDPGGGDRKGTGL